MTKPIPDGYQRLISYVVVDDATGLRRFLTEAFDARQLECITDEVGGIRHMELRIGGCVLMIAESMPDWPARPTAFYLYNEDCDDLYRRALAAGASSLMAPADQFYGDRNAGIVDPAGNQWFIATRVEDLSSEEIQRRALQHPRPGA
ncbi:MAG: VOC family protein [Gammaproteobacteria bacterium]|nr:VOC family protein [Gammaproteobacteria bacterium]